MNPKQTYISAITILLMMAAIGAAILAFDISPFVALGIFVVLTLIALLLSRRQSPRGSNRLLLGLTLLAIAGVLAVNGALAAQPQIPEGLPEEVLSLPAAYDVVPADADNFVVFYAEQDAVQLTIQFESLSSLEGYWAYEDAWVDTEGALGGTYDAEQREREPDWGDTIQTYDNPNQTVTPYFLVELPLEEKHLYDEVQVSARMNITYPELFGDDEYRERDRRARRDFTLFVASPADRVLRQQYDAWARNSGILGPGLPLLIVIGVVGALLTLWGLGKIRAAGGYGVILPSLLGKLGAVVADTALIPKQQLQSPLPKGVIVVGKIRPASPAERASLFPGDVLIEADEQLIDSHRAAKRIVERWKRGENHTLTVLRGQQTLQLYVTM